RHDLTEALLEIRVDVSRDLVGEAEFALHLVVLPPLPFAEAAGAASAARAIPATLLSAALSRGRRGRRLHLRRSSSDLLKAGDSMGPDRRGCQPEVGRHCRDAELNALSTSHV